MVVLDSSLLIAFHNQRDLHHEAAVETMEKLVAGTWGQVVLLEYVFLEVVTVILARCGRETASRVATLLLDAREVAFVPCSDLFLETLETFRSQGSHTLSFTDAAIVTVVRGDEEPAYVATFDADYRDIEGLSIVPA